MASHQPYASSFDSSAPPGDTRPSLESSHPGLGVLPSGVDGGNQEGFVGSLEVYIHQARDIHNICIYHKQDVYAKVCLTSDPEASVSSRVINGGGRNPVFNDSLRLNVRTVKSSLKCELWMMSRVKNYLQDQLLGFALVPLSDVVVAANGKITEEFSMSSTDLFHSPAGFVQLSLSYVGSSPEVMAIAAPPPTCVIRDDSSTLPDSESSKDAIPSEYEKIEFPDLKVDAENKMMVSEYFGIPCDKLVEPEGTESLLAVPEDGNCSDPEAGVRLVESFSDGYESVGGGAIKSDTPLSAVSVNGSPATLPAITQCSSEQSGTTGSANQKDKITESEVDSSANAPANAFMLPIIKIDIEPKPTVVQQDIVDMYMKSMQQFTESLAKMKLPMDVENDRTNVENGKPSSEQKSQTPNGSGTRVFYGSRAFF